MHAPWQARVKASRAEAEAYLHTHAAAVPESAGLPGASFRLRRLGGALPAPSALDLVRSAVEPGLVARLNPFLSDEARGRLHEGVLVWLQVREGVRVIRLGQRGLALPGVGPRAVEGSEGDGLDVCQCTVGLQKNLLINN